MQHKLLNLVLLAGLTLSGAAHAALHDRGGGLVYDDVQDITWLQNANLAASNTFGLPYVTNLGPHPNDSFKTYGTYINHNGSMGWGAALHWIDAMNSANYLGYNDWRLPSPFNADGTGPCFFFGCNSSEMGHLFFVDGGLSNGQNVFQSATLTQTFTNLQWTYYSGLEGTGNAGGQVWSFYMNTGAQGLDIKNTSYFAWAVRDGDISAPIPEPETYALMLAGLALVGAAARRRRG